MQGLSSFSFFVLECCQCILCLSSDSVLKTNGLGYVNRVDIRTQLSMQEEVDGCQQFHFPVYVES